jgi:hypothetical protein
MSARLRVHLLRELCKTDSVYLCGRQQAWHIGQRQIKYQPVTPSLSGSGTYSGGSPFTVRLRPEQFAQLQSLIQKALQDRTAHKVNREKGDRETVRSISS